MQIFNIGPVELILILLIMFILLGPEGMLKTARQIGAWIRQLVRSPIWRDITGYSRDIRELPAKIVRETGLDEDLEDIKKSTQQVNDELKRSVDDANKEVQQSLKEAGSVDVRLSTTPPPASQSIYPSTVPPPVRSTTTPPSNGAGTAETTTAPASVEKQPVKTEETSSPVPPVQTYSKYSSANDEDDEE